MRFYQIHCWQLFVCLEMGRLPCVCVAWCDLTAR